MKAKKYVLGHAICILLLFALLQACSGPSNELVNTPQAQNSSAPTNTPFQPSIATPTYTLEVGTLPSATSDLAFPSPTNPADIPSTTSPTIPSANPTSVSPAVSPANPTSPPPVQPPSDPTITPDVPTPPPPGDPHIGILPYNITVGGILQIMLTDFAANENVTLEVYLNAESYQLQDSFVVTVNSDGDLTFNWTVPQNYIVGSYTVLATGQTYGKSISGIFRVR